jgi:hypothetical protein
VTVTCFYDANGHRVGESITQRQQQASADEQGEQLADGPSLPAGKELSEPFQAYCTAGRCAGGAQVLVGPWMQVDPVAFASGAANFYHYVSTAAGTELPGSEES